MSPRRADRSLMDIDRVEWDEQLLDLFGLTEEPLPTIVSRDERVGTTTAVRGDDGGWWPGPRPAGRAPRSKAA